MRIKVLRNLGAGLPDYQEGQTVDCSESEAKSLAQKGLAEIIEKPAAHAKSKPAKKETTPEPKPEPKPEPPRAPATEPKPKTDPKKTTK